MCCILSNVQFLNLLWNVVKYFHSNKQIKFMKQVLYRLETECRIPCLRLRVVNLLFISTPYSFLKENGENCGKGGTLLNHPLYLYTSQSRIQNNNKTNMKNKNGEKENCLLDIFFLIILTTAKCHLGN